MSKRLYELIVNNKKFYILYFGPIFLWQVFRQIRVPEWERGMNLSWSKHIKLSRKILWAKIRSHLDILSDLQTRVKILSQ